MAGADKSPVQKDWRRKESFLSAAAQVAVVGLIMAGAVFFYYQRGVTRKEISEHMKEARSYAIRDNPAELDKALAELEKVFALDSDWPEALSMAAEIHTDRWLTHRVDGAEQKAKELLGRAVAAEARSDMRYATEAVHLIAAGKAPEAEAFIEDLRQKGANTARLWYAQGLSFQAQGRLALAKQAFAQAADKAWKDPRFSATYGEALLDESQYYQAQDMLGKAIGANPDHFRARLNTALVFVLKNENLQAVDAVLKELVDERGAELTPALKARGLAVRAQLALAGEQPTPEAVVAAADAAIVAADAALAVNPDEPVALFAKGLALAKKKDAKAVELMKQAAAKRPTGQRYYFEGSEALIAANDFAGAGSILDAYEAVFRNVTSLDSEGQNIPVLDRDDRYWIARGDLHRAQDKLDDALAAYDKAIAAKNVNNARALYAKGALYVMRKEYDKAKEALEPIVPDDGTGQVPEAYEAMGDIMMATKTYDTAPAYYGYALAGYKRTNQPKTRREVLFSNVEKAFRAAGKKDFAKQWSIEAKPMVE